MGGALGCMGPQTGPQPRRKSSFFSEVTSARSVAVGQHICCRIGFEADDDVYWRWEEAVVTDITGNVITIAMGAVADGEDRVQVDCGTDDLFNLATIDMLTGKDQRQSGDALTEDQREACCSYFDLTKGHRQPAVVPQRHENLPVREVEGLLDSSLPTAEPTGFTHANNTKPLLHKVVLCRDRFKSKKTGGTVHKWREAEITEVQGPNVKVHFTGWSDNHDVWKDLTSAELFDLAPPDGVLSRQQGIAGDALDDAQRAAALKYLQAGVVPTSPIAVVAPAVPEPAVPGDRSGRRGSGSGRINHSFVAGQQVEVQEARRDSGSRKLVLTGRWRPAIVNKVRGDVLRVHFIGFDSSWDEDIDAGEQPDRVRAPIDGAVLGETTGGPPLGAADGMGAASTPDQRRRQTSRRASFDPSQLKSYSSGGAQGESQKFRVHVEQGRPQRSSFNAVHSGSLDEAPAGDTRASSYKASEGPEGSERDTAVRGDDPASAVDMWGAVPNKASGRRSKSGKTTHQRTQTFPDPENRMIAIERYFFDAMAHNGYHVIEVEGDGNCLFRAVAHQIWLDESRHGELRKACVRHMDKHRERYEVFCPMDYDEYLGHMSTPGTWADDFEIRALEEMLDRLISIYSSDNKDIRPINKNFDEEYKLGRHVRPIILSYHGGNHYNSVFDERSPLPLGPRDSHVILDLRTGRV